jgi:hypothetical protein
LRGVGTEEAMDRPAAERYPEIDLLKGLGCALMLIGHAIRVQMPAPDTLDKLVLHVMDFSGPLFFFASGMNVMTFLERNRNKPGFRATRFYLWSAALLYVLGFTYNLNRASIGFPDIFQGVALCTAMVYVLMRRRWPTWVHFVVAFLLYFFYLQFRVRLEWGQIVPDFRALHDAIPPGADINNPILQKNMTGIMGQLASGQRWMFLNFAPFGWIAYFYFGALCYRSLRANPARARRWLLFFAGLFVAAPFVMKSVFAPNQSLLDAVFLDSYLDLVLRNIPSYVMMTLGGAGLLYLLSRRYYRGAASFGNRVIRWAAARTELLGKESFLFLVVHWWVIDTIMIVTRMYQGAATFTGNMVYDLNVYVRAALTLAVTLFAVPALAWLRDRWSRTRWYGWQIGALMVLSLMAAGALFAAAPPIGHYLTYGGSLGFAFVYPYLRARLRQRYTRPA